MAIYHLVHVIGGFQRCHEFAVLSGLLMNYWLREFPLRAVANHFESRKISRYMRFAMMQKYSCKVLESFLFTEISRNFEADIYLFPVGSLAGVNLSVKLEVFKTALHPFVSMRISNQLL